ncbi:MAG: transketolase [Calditrichia bacterium]
MTDETAESGTTKTLNVSKIAILKKSATTVRMLAVDGVQKANSGHPGMPMGMADVAVVLWMKHLKHDPADPHWPDRDRFVLSAGHGSMLLYSLLHLTGYDLPLSELQAFRQWGSKTPGHPEYGHTPGVEVTSGPLGQGISNAVGMAIAERHLAARFNQTNFEVVNHHVYVIASDGDLMEGISHEAFSLAGHLGLGRLIVLYDDNHISIDGSTDLSFSENVLQRFQAYGWRTQRVDGHNYEEIDQAIISAREHTDKPSIIACRTIIGFGSPNRANTSKVHGEPLGEEELILTKKNLGWPLEPTFYIPEDVREFMGASVERGQNTHRSWNKLFTDYKNAHPETAAEFEQQIEGHLPEGWDETMPQFSPGDSLATRAASGKVLNAISPRLPQLMGGSADLTPSNNTRPENVTDITPEDFTGRYIHFGVREHGMGAIMNGLALHGGIYPYGGTFLVFSDYMRGSIRLAALMGLKLVYVFTHDSIGLGEDGPTHQPVEHLMALRAIPNLTIIRPADAIETVEAWRTAIKDTNGPVALILTRQKLPVLPRDEGKTDATSGVSRGAYILSRPANPDVLLLASGSEVHIALEAQKILSGKNVAAQVVSIPSFELFDAQPEDYRKSVLPPEIKARVALEAGVTLGWHKYVGDYGEIIGLNRFGASAPYQKIYEGLGITAQAMAEAALRAIEMVR